MNISEQNKCPCLSGNEYSQCCGPYIKGDNIPGTPEQLMRSRYTAYTMANIDYVFATMADGALKQSDRAESLKWAKTSKWLGLEVTDAPVVNSDADYGEVEFIASFAQNNKQHKLKERAKFKKIEGRWFYTGNAVVNKNINNIDPVKVNKVGRNDPCSCGSGKKYKKCCG
jgi:SEC-C motif-containing protein